MSVLGNHIYIIYSKVTPGIVVGVDSDRDPKSTIPCHGYIDAHNTKKTFSQQWRFIKVLGLEINFKLLNLHTGTYLDLDGGSKTDGTQVQVKPQALTDPVKQQQWRFIPSGLHFRIQNVASGTYLDIDSSGGTRIEGWTGNNTTSQEWKLRRVSRSGKEVNDMVNATFKNHLNSALVAPVQFTGTLPVYFGDAIYIVLPRSVITEIHKSLRLRQIGRRNQIFDSDDFSYVIKAEVAKWGYNNLTAEGYAILFGIAFGAKRIGPDQCFNWYLTEDLNDVVFFDPQDGWEFSPDEWGPYGHFWVF